MLVPITLILPPNSTFRVTVKCNSPWRLLRVRLQKEDGTPLSSQYPLIEQKKARPIVFMYVTPAGPEHRINVICEHYHGAKLFQGAYLVCYGDSPYAEVGYQADATLFPDKSAPATSRSWGGWPWGGGSLKVAERMNEYKEARIAFALI